MSQTDLQKITQIINVLDLPRGHYTVLGPAGLVLDPELIDSETDRLDLFVSTAVWFQLYESITSGIVWTLCLPDPQDPRAKNDPPYLQYELLGITIAVGFAIAEMYTPLRLIEASDEFDGVPVYNGLRGAQWTSSDQEGIT